MKTKVIQHTAILLLTALNACSFQQSVEKDLATGAYSRGDGVNCDEVRIESSGQTGVANEFVYGETVSFVFENVNGFQKEGGKAFPGLSLHIIENERDTVLAYPDLFEDVQEGTDLSPLQLQAHFTAALPYRNNANYKVHIAIWDKKGAGTFSYELPFKVAESKLLDTRATGIDYSNIYLWNASRKETVLDSIVSQNDSLVLIIEGVDGLTVKKGNVYPALLVELTDKTGRALLSNSNMLSDFEQEGISSAEVAHEHLNINIEFTEGHINNPCKLKAVLTDQKSDKQLEVTAGLSIQ